MTENDEYTLSYFFGYQCPENNDYSILHRIYSTHGKDMHYFIQPHDYPHIYEWANKQTERSPLYAKSASDQWRVLVEKSFGTTKEMYMKYRYHQLLCVKVENLTYKQVDASLEVLDGKLNAQKCSMELNFHMEGDSRFCWPLFLWMTQYFYNARLNEEAIASVQAAMHKGMPQDFTLFSTLLDDSIVISTERYKNPELKCEV